jgi:CubicO group peptidase (beta-lactamase class C family)
LGEVAQRIDGRSFAQIVAEDISQPLGLADELFFGAPPEIETRIAKIFHRKRLFVYLPIIRELPIFRPFNQAVPPRLVPIGGDPHWDQSRFQRAVIPAGNAVMTAHALARIHAALIGEVDGVRLLSPDQLKLATTLQTSEPDKILMGQAVPKALGYWLGNNPGAPALGNDRHVFGHTGLGGMIGFADPIQDFTFALVKNRLTFRDTKDTDVRVANAVRNALGLSGMIHAGQPV